MIYTRYQPRYWFRYLAGRVPVPFVVGGQGDVLNKAYLLSCWLYNPLNQIFHNSYGDHMTDYQTYLTATFSSSNANGSLPIRHYNPASDFSFTSTSKGTLLPGLKRELSVSGTRTLKPLFSTCGINRHPALNRRRHKMNAGRWKGRCRYLIMLHEPV